MKNARKCLGGHGILIIDNDDDSNVPFLDVSWIIRISDLKEMNLECTPILEPGQSESITNQNNNM